MSGRAYCTVHLATGGRPKRSGSRLAAVPPAAPLIRAAIADLSSDQAQETHWRALDTKLDAIDRRLAKEFPEYANLGNPKPLSIAAVRPRGRHGQVVDLPTPSFEKAKVMIKNMHSCK